LEHREKRFFQLNPTFHLSTLQFTTKFKELTDNKYIQSWLQVSIPCAQKPAFLLFIGG
jgi:hypothetical protein